MENMKDVLREKVLYTVYILCVIYLLNIYEQTGNIFVGIGLFISAAFLISYKFKR